MSDETEKTPEIQRQGIGSLEIGLRILDTLAESSRPLTLKSLSETLELSPSRLHKYMVSLVRTGYIAQENGSGYILGKSSLTLGVAALSRIDPIQSAFTAIDELNRSSDKTVSVTVWNGHAPLVIKWLDASQPVAVNVRLGMELSPFYSVSGRIFLAHLPEARRDQILDSFYANPPALPRYAGKSLDRDAFIEHLQKVKDENLCSFYGDFLPDINVVGSAIHDINGNISSVISLMGLNGDTDVRPGSRYSEMVKACAAQVTGEICGRSQRNEPGAS
ncbi:IclR family transcriptional regulator [Marinobacterium sediminicola]|uniref:Transcriptional regulator, IclR family n=1 Tax=Marinobacterium sediminicola TaxID=518898 RepID=A0ABY1S190_9GAMM|nr:IclR family transcriptional regulator [Marinobacterium sediminicola]ULG68307.1 IclR family transcriptional regulator [Marinobacterium sediminicola]SMR74841.1 transcriptional regulator, IclR family [Marinobacterium sediminicola]